LAGEASRLFHEDRLERERLEVMILSDPGKRVVPCHRQDSWEFEECTEREPSLGKSMAGSNWILWGLIVCQLGLLELCLFSRESSCSGCVSVLSGQLLRIFAKNQTHGTLRDYTSTHDYSGFVRKGTSSIDEVA
jgi:hypothetical protein